MRLLAVQKHKACYIGSSNGLFKCPLHNIHTSNSPTPFFFFSILLEHVFPKHFKKAHINGVGYSCKPGPFNLFQCNEQTGRSFVLFEKATSLYSMCKEKKRHKNCIPAHLAIPISLSMRAHNFTFIAHKKRLTFEILPVFPLG